MGLYRRKNSSLWWMGFTVDGKSYKRSTGTSDKKTAQKIYDIIKGKIAIGHWLIIIMELNGIEPSTS